MVWRSVYEPIETAEGTLHDSIVATARHGDVELGVVLLHSYDPATQAGKLLDRGFKAMRRQP